MPFRLEARGQNSVLWSWLSPVIAILATLIVSTALFAAMGKPAGDALYTFVVAPASSLNGLAELGVKAAPLVLIGVGLAIGFRANVWNIGAEGQLILGAIVGGGIGLAAGDREGFWILPAMILGGAVGGALWAAIPALLKTHFNASEILTSLMLNYVAQLLLIYLVVGPWKDPEGYGFPQTRLFGDAATMPILISGTRVHLGVLAALIAVALGWLLHAKTLLGFQLRVLGQAPRAAAYAGFSGAGLTWFALLLGGALAGLAGIFEAAGPIGQLTPSISPGYGFTAIIVAFLGRLNPVGVLLGGIVLALSYLGGEQAQIALGLPKAITGIYQGVLLFFLLAADLLVGYRIRLVKRVPAGGAA
ncbi:ABC transporter permease [Dongia sedimenti]|uniref:ABC transporter permease n=1 Tax=Dongia sedimenti TaxID=3064282 RepID=A0ABU0YHN8_9PROT|nr:ABC transporter permease [Rhodospirillaceae bacterium R-7]